MLKGPISFYLKIIKKDNIPLQLPHLKMTGLTAERESSIKLLAVWIDENLTWGGAVHSHTFLK